jgi:hypothetical protein
MKLITNSILKQIKFVALLLLLSTQLIISLKLKAGDNKDQPIDTKSKYFETAGDAKSFKFLFMYKYPMVQNEPNHKLNLFSYKNVLFSKDQVVYFESTNESEPVSI